MFNQTQERSPALFFDTVRAYQRTAALKAAIELDLFTVLGEGKDTAPALAARCGTSERGMRILCDYLVVVGFLAKERECYKLTLDSAMFLDRRSSRYIGSAIEFLLSPLLTDAFNDVAAAVRKGGTVMSEAGTLAPEHPVWVQFARSIAPLAALQAQSIASLVDADGAPTLRVLDIAAGHGMYGITLAQHNPNAEVVALDWPNVLELAKENARAAGVGRRYRTIAGSAIEVDYGSGYDLALLTNFLHHFDPTTCERLLEKVYAALAAGGRAVTLEFVPNEDRVSPPEAAAFSLVMLATTPSGDAYTFSQLDRMFRRAGFSRCQCHPLPPPSSQQVVISYK